MNETVPFNLPTIEDEELDEVVATLRSGWLTTGPKTAQFEAEFGAYVGAPHALAVNSATAGLHLALAALGLGPGDEVITTPLTFCSTVTTILHVGATPVLADIGMDGNIDPKSITERITPRTRAILPVHLGGLPCDMEAIWSIARDHGLFVIEDAAHAVGSHYEGVPIGRGAAAGGFRSDAVVYSFYATKNLTTGEGGMVTTHRPHVHEKMRLLCLHGISRDAWNRYADRGNWHYDVTACGFKYNLSDIQSAIGIQQLRKQERFLAARAQYARVYTDAFADVDEARMPSRRPVLPPFVALVRDQTEPRIAGYLTRRVHSGELRKRNIGSSVHFIPIPELTFFAQYAGLPHNRCPNAGLLYPRLISLPLYPAMTLRQVAHVIESVKAIVRSARKAPLVAATSFSDDAARFR